MSVDEYLWMKKIRKRGERYEDEEWQAISNHKHLVRMQA
jgi:hypothetical protein